MSAAQRTLARRTDQQRLRRAAAKQAAIVAAPQRTLEAAMAAREARLRTLAHRAELQRARRAAAWHAVRIPLPAIVPHVDMRVTHKWPTWRSDEHPALKHVRHSLKWWQCVRPMMPPPPAACLAPWFRVVRDAPVVPEATASGALVPDQLPSE